MTVRNPQLFHSTSLDTLPRFIADQDWVLEQKVDGMRCLTVINAQGIEFYTRGGKPLVSSAAKLHFDSIRETFSEFQQYIATSEAGQLGEFVLDGELLTDQGILVLLDLPYVRAANGNDFISPHQDFQRRTTLMRQYWSQQWRGSTNVRVVRQAQTTAEKHWLVDNVFHNNLEGLIAKHRFSPYDEGKRVTHSLKLKITQTADVIVTAKNSGESKHSKRGGDKINYEFGVLSPDAAAPAGSDPILGHLVHIGNCSGIGKEDAQVGDVIEVEYLYTGAGGKLVQPRMLRVREDKWPGDCTIDQLKHVNKEVL